MDSSRDHLELEIAGLRADLSRLVTSLNDLERRLRLSRVAPPVEPRTQVEQAPLHVPRAAPPSIRVTAAEIREQEVLERSGTSPSPTPPAGSVANNPPPPRAMAEHAARAFTSVAHAPKSAWSWEKLIGAKAFAAAGALIVVLGVAFFLKLAIDEGWIRRIPPVWRCIGAGGFGCVLVVLGEIARKKISTLASTGLTAAGIATVYASVFGAHEMFGLLAPPAAMAMLAGVTACGIGLGVIGRRVFLSILSVVGAYLAPVLLSTDQPSPFFFPAYLVALLALGLTLGGWIGPRFHVLRSLTWWGTMVLGTIWIFDWAWQSGQINGLVFAGVVWALTHAELIASARFFRRLRGDANAAAQTDDDTPVGALKKFHARWLVSSFGVTTWALGIGIALLRRLDPTMDYLAPVFLGGGLAAVSVIAMPRIMEIVTDRRMPRAQLATATVIQLGAMVIAAVALGLTSWFQVVAWVTLGLAAVITGERLGVKALRIYGIVLLCIGTVRVVMLDWMPVMMLGFNDPVPIWAQKWGLLAWPVGAQLVGAGLAWFIGAMVVRRRMLDSIVMASIGVASAMMSLVVPGAEGGSVGVAWVVFGFVLAMVSRTRCVPRLGAIAIGPVVASWCAWLAAYANPDGWNSGDGPAIGPMGVVQGAAIVCTALALLGVLRREDRTRAVSNCVLVGTGLMVIAVAALGFSGWVQVAVWLTLGLGCVVGGEWMRRPGLLVYGTVLLGIGTALVVIREWMVGCLGLQETTTDLELWGLALGSVSAQFGGAALAWFIGSAVVRTRERSSYVMAALATACAMAAFLVPEAHAGSIGAAWAVLGLGLAALSRTGWFPKLGVITTAVVTVAWIPWTVAHLNPDAWVASIAPPMLSLGMRQAMVIGAASILSVRVQRPSDWRQGAMRLTLVITCLFLFIATSFEVHRLVTLWVPGDLTARRAGVSIWWAVIGLGALAFGSIRRTPIARWVGLGLLGAAAAKLVVFDLIEISMVWRVVASMVIGLILLGVAVGYARAMRGMRGDAPASAQP